MSASDQRKPNNRSPLVSLYKGDEDNAWPKPWAHHLQVSVKVIQIPYRFCNSDVPVHLDLSGAHNLQVIGQQAFHCTSLQTIVWPGEMTTNTREDEDEEEEEEYHDGNASPKLQEIREEAFAMCSSLEELDLSNLSLLTSIGQSSFLLCSALKTIKMARNLCQIGERAFAGCEALRGVHWNDMPLTELRADLFVKCSQLKCLDLSRLKELQIIGPRVFKECTGLEHVKFPSTLGSIGVGAFYGCKSLKQVEFACSCTASTKKLQIGQAAFAKCTALVFIDLPKYVTRLAPLTFWGCRKLEKVVLPLTLESIGGSAMGNCVSLKEVTLPPNMKEESIGPNAFFNCLCDQGTDVWYWYYPRHENDYDQNIFDDGRSLPSSVSKVKIVAIKQWLPSCFPLIHPNGKDALEWVDLQGNDLLHAIQLSLMYPRATALSLPMERLIRIYNTAPVCRSDFNAAIDDRRKNYYSDVIRLLLFAMRNDREKCDIMNKFGEIQLAHATTIHQLVSKRVELDLPFEPFAFFCE